MRVSRAAGRIGRIGRIGLLLGALGALGACGGGNGATGPSGTNSFLYQHNARFNGGRTVRWPSLPIQVFANDIAQPAEVTEWTGASGGQVTFAFVGGSPAAGISFRFRGGADICGLSTVEYQSDGRIVSADVQVSEAIYRGPQCVRTVTHEIGHAIGFLDHTEDGGLMDDDGGSGKITAPVAGMMRDLYLMGPGSSVSAGEKLQTALRPSGGRYTRTFIHPVRAVAPGAR